MDKLGQGTGSVHYSLSFKMSSHKHKASNLIDSEGSDDSPALPDQPACKRLWTSNRTGCKTSNFGGSSKSVKKHCEDSIHSNDVEKTITGDSHYISETSNSLFKTATDSKRQS